MKSLVWPLCLVISVLLFSPTQAQDLKSLLSSESEVSQHEIALSDMALATEEWLAGRLKQKDFLQGLGQTEKALKPYTKLPEVVAAKVHASELAMLRQTQGFAKAEAPDSEGQRVLFEALGGHYEARTKALMNWRIQQNKVLRGKQGRDGYLAWEAHWLPIWLEEATLTRQLQLGLLSQKKSGDQRNREILKSLLRLRLQGNKASNQTKFQSLQNLAQERLTILARTAEQLLRMEKRKSRGALTRVRRLSKKLTQLTQQFQAERIKQLKRL